MQTLCRAATRSCASFHRKMRRWAHQRVRTARHTRSNQNPENAVAQAIPASGSRPPLSLCSNEYPLVAKGRNVLVRHERLLSQRRTACLLQKTVTQSGHGGRCVTGRSLHAPIWTVCRAPYIQGGFLFMRTPDFGASFEGADSFKCWFRLRAS